MLNFVHNLAFLMVVYHTLVGCCGHHAHAGQPLAPAGPAACHCDVPHGDDLARAPAEPSELPQPQHHHHDCGDRCVFVVPSTGQTSSDDMHICPLEQPADVLPAVAAQSHSFASWESPRPEADRTIRLHLWHQRLLI